MSLHYKPLHEFTSYKKTARIYDKLDNSKNIYKQILSLPMYPGITKKQIDHVVKFLKNN